MKNFTRSPISSLLIFVFLLTLGTPSLNAFVSETSNQRDKQKDYKVKRGRELAARVGTLKENNRNIRAALRAFEVRGHKPKIEESFAITGSRPSSDVVRTKECITCGVFQRASFSQQSVISGDGVEIIFVPTVSMAGEWQGTVIATRYDGNGNFIDQYVSNSILVMPDPNSYQWDEVYEAPAEGGVLQPPISEPGMFTNVDLGVPLDGQRDLLMQQPISKTDRSNSTPITSIMKANFVQNRRARVRAWARCSFAWCGGAGVLCVGVNIWNAELLAGPCFAVGCGTSMIGCTWGTLWQ